MAEVDCDIPNMAGKHAHQFALWLLKLIMQAAKHSPLRERFVILHKSGRQPNRREAFRIK